MIRRRLGAKDFEKAFGEPLSRYVRERIERYRFQYRALTPAERDAWLRRIVQALIQRGAVRAGARRHAQWEAGWEENVMRFKRRPVFRSMVPGYFGKYPVVRWRQDFIHPLNRQFEYNSLAIIQDWLFDRYLRDAENVYEFGCGTGHNLFRVREVNPHARLHGLDWSRSSQRLLTEVRRSGLDRRMVGRHFDLFHPDRRMRLEPGSCVYTVASLEQIGERFGPFLDFVLGQPVRLCLHIEPIGELLDPCHLLDNLSLEYFKMRNYLRGYLDRLRELERQGRVRIHRAQRSYIGSLFIDGYSVIVWSPCDTVRRRRPKR